MKATLYVGLLVASTGVTTLLAAYAYRHRDEPGVGQFAALMASISVWCGAYAAGLLTFDPAWRVFMEYFQWPGIAGVPVWLLLFTLAYTGHDEFVTRRTVAGLYALPTAVVALAWTNPWHHLVWRDARVVVDGVALIEFAWGPMFWVFIAYTYVLVAVACALVLRLVFLSEYLYADQSALLLVGIAAPVFANLLFLFGPISRPTVEFPQYAFTITGLTFGYALFRRRLFDLVPATRRLGRNAAISQLEDGVLIVDTARRVVYCNGAAGDVVGLEPAEALGSEVRSLVDDSRIDFETEDALAEIERDDRVYEVRTSPITDRKDRLIGHTLVIHDVTARKERERALAAQRDDLERLEQLNAVLRGVNQALVSATSRSEIEQAACDRLADADLYRTVCIADVATWTGDADRWRVAGDGREDAPSPPALDDDFDRDGDGDAETHTVASTATADGGTWTVVPVSFGRTVFGAVGLYTDREDVSDRERAVLGELGETVGHAVNAVETQQLLSADAVVELKFESTGEGDPLVAASTDVPCRFELVGLVPGSEGPTVAYLRVDGEDPAAARDRLADAATGSVRTAREDGLLEWQVTGDALLGTLVEYGANVRSATVEDGRARYEAELASGADVRSLSDCVDRQFPDARIASKRERGGPVKEPAAITGGTLADLTDRQREAIEAAYRAGYFDWPRESTAEEVADALDIASATLHGHLRKAQRSVLEDVFDSDGAR